VKYFGFELGALTKIDTVNNKCIVNGKRDAETLAVVLDSFIQRYVLCQKCRNPETVLTVKGETITSQCKACGKTNQIDMSHKLSTYILKNPPEKSEGGATYVF
jgi:translation initiation factor 5